jgi:hypothetical protein
MTDAADPEVIEGFYDWGPGVVVTADCLGQSHQTSLAGRPLIVKMPVFDGNVIVEPAPRYKRPDSYVDVDPPDPWGEVRSSNTAEDGSVIPVTVCIKRVRLWFPVSPVEATNPLLGPHLDNRLSPWWDALSAWIEVTTGQDLASLGDRRPKRPQTFHLWGGNADGTMRPLAMLFQATGFPPSHPLPAEGLRTCLAAVAEGRAAPQERLHLSDARSLHNNGQWRRAVIDAATAAEVAITSWIDSNANSDVKADLAKKPKPLGALWPLYKRLGGAVPDNFQKLVVDPRNDAAHRGMALTSEQSAAAIDATAELVAATTPMDALFGQRDGH